VSAAVSPAAGGALPTLVTAASIVRLIKTEARSRYIGRGLKANSLAQMIERLFQIPVEASNIPYPNELARNWLEFQRFLKISGAHSFSNLGESLSQGDAKLTEPGRAGRRPRTRMPLP